LVRAVVGVMRSISPLTPEPRDLEVVTITPSVPLGTLWESVRWTRDAVLRSIDRGAADARRALSEIQAGRDPAQPVLQ
jgi:hypothetical protein